MKKKLLAVALSSLMILGVGSALTSCGEESNFDEVTVENTEAKVVVNDNFTTTTLTGIKNGDLVKVGTTISFKVEARLEGYTVSEVIINGKAQTLSSDGNYTYTVTEDDIKLGEVKIFTYAKRDVYVISGTITMGGEKFPTEYLDYSSLYFKDDLESTRSAYLTVDADGQVSYQITVDKARTYTISFKTLSLNYNGSNNFKTVTLEEGVKFDKNDSKNFELPEKFVGDNFIFNGVGTVELPFNGGTAQKQIFNFVQNGRIAEDFTFGLNLKIKAPLPLVKDGEITKDPFDGALEETDNKMLYEILLWSDGTGTDTFPAVSFDNGVWSIYMSLNGRTSEKVALPAEIVSKLDSNDGLNIFVRRDSNFYSIYVMNGEEKIEAKLEDPTFATGLLAYVDGKINFESDSFDAGVFGDGFGATFSALKGEAIPYKRVSLTGAIELNDGIDYDTEISGKQFNLRSGNDLTGTLEVLKLEDGTYKYKATAPKNNSYKVSLSTGSNKRIESLDNLSFGEEDGTGPSIKLYKSIFTSSGNIKVKDAQLFNADHVGGIGDFTNDFAYTTTVVQNNISASLVFDENDNFKQAADSGLYNGRDDENVVRFTEQWWCRNKNKWEDTNNQEFSWSIVWRNNAWMIEAYTNFPQKQDVSGGITYRDRLSKEEVRNLISSTGLKIELRKVGNNMSIITTTSDGVKHDHGFCYFPEEYYPRYIDGRRWDTDTTLDASGKESSITKDPTFIQLGDVNPSEELIGAKGFTKEDFDDQSVLNYEVRGPKDNDTNQDIDLIKVGGVGGDAIGTMVSTIEMKVEGITDAAKPDGENISFKFCYRFWGNDGLPTPEIKFVPNGDTYDAQLWHGGDGLGGEIKFANGATKYTLSQEQLKALENGTETLYGVISMIDGNRQLRFYMENGNKIDHVYTWTLSSNNNNIARLCGYRLGCDDGSATYQGYEGCTVTIDPALYALNDFNADIIDIAAAIEAKK